MDSFMQELKREQAGRGSGNARPDSAAASDVDPLSTNLYVANLPTNIDERVFGEHFAHFGDIASVRNTGTDVNISHTSQGQNTLAAC